VIVASRDAEFVGSIPQNYDRYLVPLIFQEYAEDLARRVAVPAGGAVLEIAAGTGVVSRELRKALPSDVRLVVTDLNQAMLDVAKQKFDASQNIEFQTADATNLSFPDATFDAVVCQFGIMFFPDKLAGMKQAARVLKPGGTFVFNVWDSFDYNHIARVVKETLKSLFPAGPLVFYDTPYGYYRVDQIREQVGNSGFGDIEIAVLPRMSGAETAREIAVGYLMGTPASSQLAGRDGYTLEQIAEHVENALTQNFGESPMRTKMQAIVFAAHLDTAGK
jgi:ubiquinone/menaquinone biosynthesis C-methylase UbiE